MKRDFKIGMAIGLLLVGASALWISTRPALSTQMLLTRRTRPDGPSIPAASTTTSRIVPSAQTRVPRQTETTIRQTSPAKEPPAAPPQAQNVRIHIVASNETLSDIARTYYGSPAKWRTIYNANKTVIANPDRVSLGTKLVIPQ